MSKKILDKINGNLFVKHLVLALCGIVVFLFVAKVALNVFTRHDAYIEVPDLSGMPLADAMAAARGESLRIQVNDSIYMPAYEPGAVLSQIPDPGTQVKSGRRIFVTVNSHQQKMVRVPYVTGVSLRQAKNTLEVAGLEVEKLVYRGANATNYVLETRYGDKVIGASTNIEAEQGSGIVLVVGVKSDEGVVAVPKIVGFPLRQARSRLWEVGINIGNVTFDEGVTLMNRNEARVYSQTPEQGTKVSLGASVGFRLGLDQEKVERGSSASDRAAARILSRQATEEQAGQDAQ